jgi:glycosyltransferase involved in cell wall biosynthesis
LKIAIIGPGLMPIPPKGWGAIESLIWDYSEELLDLDHEVAIFNNRDLNEVIADVNSFNPDFVHLQYDDYILALNHINCKHKAITTHYAYLEQPRKHGPYAQIFNAYKSVPSCYVFALSEGIKNTFMELNSIPEERIFITPNGAREDLFAFDQSCSQSDNSFVSNERESKPGRSIYLAKIDYRKRQHLFQKRGMNIDFVGNHADPSFDVDDPAYLGEWNKEFLYKNLTNYANMVLLSDGEAHSLSCLEGLMSGLGLVISEYCTANLDTSLPFIDVIPENRILDDNFVRKTIALNRQKSISMRKDIRKYAVDNFSWKVVVKKYSDTVEKIING